MFADNRAINLCWFERHYQAALTKVIDLETYNYDSV